MQGTYGRMGYYNDPHYASEPPPLPDGPPPLPPQAEPQQQWQPEGQSGPNTQAWSGRTQGAASGEPSHAPWSSQGAQYLQHGQSSYPQAASPQQGSYAHQAGSWPQQHSTLQPGYHTAAHHQDWQASEHSGWQSEPPLPPDTGSAPQPPQGHTAGGYGWESRATASAQHHSSQQYPYQGAGGRSRWDESGSDAANSRQHTADTGRSRWEEAEAPQHQPSPPQQAENGLSRWEQPPVPGNPPPLPDSRSDAGRSRWDEPGSAGPPPPPQGGHAPQPGAQQGRSRWDSQDARQLPDSSHAAAPPPNDSAPAPWKQQQGPTPPSSRGWGKQPPEPTEPPALPWQTPSGGAKPPGAAHQAEQSWETGHQGYGGYEGYGVPPPPADPPLPDGPAEAMPWQQAGTQAEPSGEPNAAEPEAPAPPLPNGHAEWPSSSAAAPAQTGEQHQAAAEGAAAYQQQWDAQWPAYQQQGYAGYQQGYGGYNGYGGAYQDPSLPQASAQAQPAAYAGQQGYQGSYAWPQGHQQEAWGQAGVVPTLRLPTKNEVDAEDIFKKPGRDHRPSKIAIILRGLPGSGKTHIAKKLREVELENGGEAPRIHALDDYFVTEVEKEVIEEQPGKKPKKRKEMVMEYLYEQELEDSYRASILKAFTKTVEEGRFPFVILDAPNIQVEDFRPFYMAAQQVGYEVYVLKPLERDPEVCFQRNVHQREQETIADLAVLYEPTPNIYTQILVESLFDLPRQRDEDGIEEVDMDKDGREEEAEEEKKAEPETKSRWASLEEEEPEEVEEAPKKKKRRKEVEVEEPKPAKAEVIAVQKTVTPTSILRKAGDAPPGKGVRWADEPDPAAELGILQSSTRALAEVHYLEGLGPAPDSQHNNPTHDSFAEMAEQERKTEKKSFREILFGGGQ